MLYIKRNKDGAITGITENKRGAEPLDLKKEDVRAWLKQEGLSTTDVAEKSLLSSDLDLVRVIEDLIRVLTRRGVIQLTDLPEEAVSKLSMRTNLRQHRSTLDNLVADDEERIPL